jgi:hypothetical protein
MAKITSQCKELINVQLCDHATSCLQIVASKIQALHVNHANESMHLGMILNHMEDGLGNSIITSKIDMKLCCNMQILASTRFKSGLVLYILRAKRNNICYSMHL